MIPMETSPDVLVVGGGPAGATLATLMARRGWAVTVVDRGRFPRPKPCGEFLSPGALGAMGRMGLPLPGPDAGRLEGWTLTADGVTVTASFREGAVGASVPRSRLDATLLDTARNAGAKYCSGVPIH